MLHNVRRKPPIHELKSRWRRRSKCVTLIAVIPCHEGVVIFADSREEVGDGFWVKADKLTPFGIRCDGIVTGIRIEAPALRKAPYRRLNSFKTAVAATVLNCLSYQSRVGRFHNPKVGGSIPPPATNLPFYFQRLTTNWRSAGESLKRHLL